MPPKKLFPAVLGGLFIGIMSSLPLVSLGNCICCLWIVGGGFLAAYLSQQDYPSPISTSDGALAGFLAGVLGAVFCTIIAIPIEAMMGPIQAQLMSRVLSSRSDIPPGVREMFENFQTGGASIVISAIIRFCTMLVLGAIFSTIGGIFGAIFTSRPAPPASIPPMPSDVWSQPQ
jgi:hypothetical protein